jgi:hypothetical protein
MWRITQTTDTQHVGVLIENIEVGQIITFEDGDVVPISRIFTSPDGTTMIACSTTYQMTLTKE